MPAKSGKTSPALVGFLIFFILTTIILGVTTYLGFSGQDALSAAAKKATDEEGKWKKDNDWNRFLAISLKSYAGYPLTNDDKEAIATLRRDFTGGSLVTNARAKDKEEDAKLIKDLDAKYHWDDNEKKAQTSLQDRIAALTKEKDTATKSWDAAKADADRAQKAQAQTQKDMEAAQTGFTDDLKKLKATFGQDMNKYIARTTDLQKQLDDKGKDMEALKTAADQQQAENAKEKAKWQRERKQLVNKNDKLQQKVAPVNVIDYDQPKGKIVAINPDGRMPFINLGSADRVKPQLTFSVYGVGPGGKPVAHDVIGPDGKPVLGADNKPEKEGKATIEVVSVIGEHLSQARVTSVRDPNSDPILRGDLLFNPAWSPNERQHVAITGLVDLGGDGHDDLREFLRTLEGQGVTVDAYLDLKDLTVKGPGIDRQTDYLILGDNVPGQDRVKENSPEAKRLEKIIDLRTKMQDEAARDGVTVISLRKFLALTGYHVPRAVGNADAYKYGSGAPAYYGKQYEEKQPAAEKKPAAGKKDEDKGKDKDKDKDNQ